MTRYMKRAIKARSFDEARLVLHRFGDKDAVTLVDGGTYPRKLAAAPVASTA